MIQMLAMGLILSWVANMLWTYKEEKRCFNTTFKKFFLTPSNYMLSFCESIITYVVLAMIAVTLLTAFGVIL